MIAPVKIDNINIKQECDTEQCGVFYRNYEKNMEIDINFGCYSFPEADNDVKMKVISEENNNGN